VITIASATEEAVRHALLRLWCRQLQQPPATPAEARALAGPLAALLDRVAGQRRVGPTPELDAQVSRLLGRLAARRLVPPLPGGAATFSWRGGPGAG
jgi:hypothetical protein